MTHIGKALSPRTTLLVGTSILIALSILTSLWGVTSPWLTLNENQVFYLFSTTAQVIAAVYGLTLTGFLFFRNELTREVTEDETLKEPIDELKSRYFKLLIYITALVAITLFLANLVISHEASPHTDQTNILINTGQSSFLVAFIAITLFVFDVIAPRRIEEASQSLQNELDPSLTKDHLGSLEEFLRNYNQIESLLSEAGKPYQPSMKDPSQLRQPKRMSNIRLADILLRSEKISWSLSERLRELITLRNAIIHGAEPIVSQSIVKISAEVLSELKKSLESEPS